MHVILILFGFLFLPLTAFANSAAPLLPVVSSMGIFLLPIIVIIEGIYYRKRGIPKSFSFAFKVNLFSTFAGLIIFFIPGMILYKKYGIVIESSYYLRKYMEERGNNPAPLIYKMIGSTVLFLMLNCLFSAWLEHWRGKKLKQWQKVEIPFRWTLTANILSYIFLLIRFYFTVFIGWLKLIANL